MVAGVSLNGSCVDVGVAVGVSVGVDVEAFIVGSNLSPLISIPDAEVLSALAGVRRASDSESTSAVPPYPKPSRPGVERLPVLARSRVVRSPPSPDPRDPVPRPAGPIRTRSAPAIEQDAPALGDRLTGGDEAWIEASKSTGEGKPTRTRNTRSRRR